MNERLYSYREMERLPEEFQIEALKEPLWETSGPSDPRQRRAQLAETAQILGYPPVRDRQDWILEARPGGRGVVRQVFSRFDERMGDIAYTYYSSAVHGTVFGLMSGLVLDSGSTHRAISASPEASYAALLGVTVCYLEAGSRITTLMGWRDFGWPNWVKHAERELVEVMSEHGEPRRQDPPDEFRSQAESNSLENATEEDP
jgi:hypothetical protein